MWMLRFNFWFFRHHLIFSLDIVELTVQLLKTSRNVHKKFRIDGIFVQFGLNFLKNREQMQFFKKSWIKSRYFTHFNQKICISTQN